MKKETERNGGATSQHTYYFLSEKAAKKLPHYQYKGEDQSLLYGYVLSPLANFCVNNLTPRWLAPNTITLMGLLLMAAAYAIAWFYTPDLEPTDAPRWIFLFNGIAVLTYQTLDNMDGKQSRRTGSSSPLGLLFDHGCDAVNPLFGSVNWIIAMALSPVADTRLCFIILFGPSALFYVGTWEEYYTGELIMPIVNGPSEGLLGGALLSFTSFWNGHQYWLETNWWSDWIVPSFSRFASSSALSSMPALRNADIIVLLASIGFIQETTLKMSFVARTYGAKTLLNLLPFATLIISAVAVGYADLDVWLSCPRISVHLSAILFTEMTTDLMLCHMGEEKFQPFRWQIVPLVIFTVMVCTGFWSAGELTQNYLLSYASALGAYLCLRLAVLINEICCLLQIWCFDIITPRRSQTAQNSDPKLC